MAIEITGATKTISCSTSSAAGTQTQGEAEAGGLLYLYNTGAVPVFFRFSTDAEAATTADFPIPAGKDLFIKTGVVLNYAAITGSSTATLYVTPCREV